MSPRSKSHRPHVRSSNASLRAPVESASYAPAVVDLDACKSSGLLVLIILRATLLTLVSG